MNTILKIRNILLLPLVVIMAFSIVSPQKAHAQLPGLFVPVFDGINAIPITANAATNAMELAWDSITQHTMNILAYQAGQMALDMLTQNTISWIKGGFNGSPSFAIDANEIFLNLADSVSGGFASEIRGLATCDFTPNFNNDLANSIELSTRRDAYSKFARQASCPFSSININASDFYDAGVYTFEQNGGWDGLETALNDNGNPFGVRLIASEELAARQEAVRSVQEQKLSWSNGFMNLVDTNNCNYPAGMDTSFEGVDPGPRASLQQTYCQTTTPGKIVQDQLSDTLGTDMQRLGFADNLDKIISALIGQLTKEAVGGIFK